METHAERDGRHWAISGRKLWITAAYGNLLSGHQVLFRVADQALRRDDQQRVDGAFDNFERLAAPNRAQIESDVARLTKELL